MSNIFNPSGVGGGGLTNVNVSAGTTSNNLSNVVFSNLNGVSFGLAGSTITASVGAAGGGLTNINISAGTTSNNLSALTFANSNGVSFGLNGSVVTGTVNTNYQSQGAYLTTARASNDAIGLNSALTANGVSVTANSSGLSLNFPAFLTTAQPPGAYLTTARASNDGVGLNTALTANGVAWTVNSSGISLNVPAFLTTAAQSGHSHGNPTLALTNLTGTTASASNGFTLSLSAAAPGGGGSINISAGTTSNNLTAFTFNDIGGVSFGLNGSVITAAAPAGGGGITNINVSAGTTSQNLSKFTLDNSNGVSFGLNGSVITATVATNYQSQGAYLTTARVSNDAIGLNSALTANGVSVTANSSGLSLNFPAFLTTAMQSQSSSVFAKTGFTTAATAGAVLVGTHDTAGLNLGVPAWLTTAQPPGAYLTTARASNDAVGLNTAATQVTWTVNSSGISLNAGAYLTTAMASNAATISNIRVSAGVANANLSAITFDNAGGVSFGLAGSVITASAPGGGGGLTQGTFYATSNTTQSSSGTLAFSNLIFAGAGIASVGVSGGSVVVSVPSGGGAGDGYNIVSMLTSTSGGGTAGATFSALSASVGLMAGSNITLSQTSNTINIIAPNSSLLTVGNGLLLSSAGSTFTLAQEWQSSFQNAEYIYNTIALATASQGTSVVFPIYPHQYVSHDYARMLHSISMASTSFASTGNTSYSYNQAITYNFVVYSQGINASSQSLISIASNSAGITWSGRLSRNTTNNISVSHGITYPVSNSITTTASWSYAATNSSDQWSSTHLTALSGVKMFDTRWASTLPDHVCWVAFGLSTSQTTQQTANLSAIRILDSIYAFSQANFGGVGRFNESSAASNQIILGVGSFTTAGGATVSAMGFSNITSAASNLIPVLILACTS